MIIETTQKIALLDEAAKLGITRFQLSDVPATLTKLLGDNKLSYGLPLAIPYEAINRESIDVSKIIRYFSSLKRDVLVGTEALKAIKLKQDFLAEEFWVRTQNLKNKALYLQHTANLEGFRNKERAVWVYGDSFSDTSKLDISSSSAWVDSSEGVVMLPSTNNSIAVLPGNITVDVATVGFGSDNLKSDPSMAVDGLENTSWKGLFTSTEAQNSAVFVFNKDYNLTGVQLDPTGYGMEVLFEADSGQGFVKIFKEILFSKSTFSVGQRGCKKVRVSYNPSGSVLPKTAGLRNIRFLIEDTVDQASLYTTTINIPVGFSELFIDTEASIPDGSYIKSFVSFSAGPWIELKSRIWNAIVSNDTLTINLDRSTQEISGGFYAIPTLNGPRTATEGVLQVGPEQIEVSAFKKDYVALGEIPHVPQPEDFKQQDIKKFKTWLNVPIMNDRIRTNRVFLDPTTSQTTTIARGTDIFAFSHQVEGQKFHDLGILALNGGETTSICQPNYTYKASFYVFIQNDYFIDYSKYFFLQGYRSRLYRSFGETGKSYGSFTMSINGVNVASSSKPTTIYTSVDSNGSVLEGGVNGVGQNGTSFNYSLKRGWNLVEILVHTIDPRIYGADSGNSGKAPHLFLSIFPSFFDENFRRTAGIVKIIASGESNPLSEFELLWNTPPDHSFWAWSSTDKKVLFNTWNTVPIDAYLKGTGPAYKLEYKKSPDSISNNSSIKIRFDLLKDSTVIAGPVLRNYKISVK